MKRHAILLFGIALVAISCKKQPTAAFAINEHYPAPGEEIEFYNSSTDAKSYSWDFGDGNWTNLTDPTHTFTEEGTYYVTLTAYSRKEKLSDQMTLPVLVQIPPTAQEITEEKLIGKWNYDSTSTRSYTNDVLTGSFDTDLTALYTIRDLTFHSNNSYTIDFDGTTSSGSWSVSEDGDYLTLNSTQFLIDILDNSSLHYYDSTVTVAGPDTYIDRNFNYLSK